MSSLQKGEKGQWLEQEKGSSSSLGFLSFFLERERLLSSFPANPTVGTRREVVLRGEGFAWVPDLRSLDKLLDVGVSPYLGFTLYLSVFQCFSWLEALNDRLIGPKAWDRIDLIY